MVVTSVETVKLLHVNKYKKISKCCSLPWQFLLIK